MNPAPKILLLVEDDADEAQLLCLSLGRHGWNVTLVRSLGEALTAVKGNGFSVVLLDLGLPDSSPDQTYQAVKTLSPITPVVALTGYGHLEEKLRSQGVEEFLPKNICRDELLMAALDRALIKKAERTLEKIDTEIIGKTMPKESGGAQGTARPTTTES